MLADEQLFGINRQHFGDIGMLLINRKVEVSESGLYFSFSNLSPHLGISGGCVSQPTMNYVSYLLSGGNSL